MTTQYMESFLLQNKNSSWEYRNFDQNTKQLMSYLSIYQYEKNLPLKARQNNLTINFA